MTILQIIAVAFLLVSFIMAVIYQANLQNPLLWAVWAADILFVFGGIAGLGSKAVL